MEFQRVDPNSHYRLLRLVSTGARWDLGFSPYHHGIRLRMGPFGKPPSVLDFCLGKDPELWSRVLAYTLDRLAPLPESVDAKTIDAVFPWANTRPNLRVHLPQFFQEPADVSPSCDGRLGEASLPSRSATRLRQLRSLR